MWCQVHHTEDTLWNAHIIQNQDTQLIQSPPNWGHTLHVHMLCIGTHLFLARNLQKGNTRTHCQQPTIRGHTLCRLHQANRRHTISDKIMQSEDTLNTVRMQQIKDTQFAVWIQQIEYTHLGIISCRLRTHKLQSVSCKSKTHFADCILKTMDTHLVVVPCTLKTHKLQSVFL